MNECNVVNGERMIEVSGEVEVVNLEPVNERIKKKVNRQNWIKV